MFLWWNQIVYYDVMWLRLLVDSKKPKDKYTFFKAKQQLFFYWRLIDLIFEMGLKKFYFRVLTTPSNIRIDISPLYMEKIINWTFFFLNFVRDCKNQNKLVFLVSRKTGKCSRFFFSSDGFFLNFISMESHL